MAVATRSPSTTPFEHVPTTYTRGWLAVSLPLIVWDTAYVLGRPHTMEGGRIHWPLWAPYKLYGEVDYVYGWKALREENGFVAAQAVLNALEAAMYLSYLWLWRSGKASGDGQARAVRGRAGAVALLVGFTAAVMTLSKTVLYWCNEYFSGFGNTGHNDWTTLIFLWIIPNGAWLVGSSYMVMSMGTEILDKLEHTARVKTE